MTLTATRLKLNLGCGHDRLDGWVNVDSHTAADVDADMLALPFDNDAADEIYCSHALEHLSFYEAPRALREMLRVLRPGGKLRVAVPNLDFVAAVWLHGSDRDYARQIMFGNQEHPGEFHRNGWNERQLRADVEAAGFVVADSAVRWTAGYSQESVVVEATKP